MASRYHGRRRANQAHREPAQPIASHARAPFDRACAPSRGDSDNAFMRVDGDDSARVVARRRRRRARSSDKMRADTEVVASSSSRVVVRVLVPHDHLRRTWMRQSRTGDTAAPVPLDVYGTRRARGDGRGADVVAWRATERPRRRRRDRGAHGAQEEGGRVKNLVRVMEIVFGDDDDDDDEMGDDDDECACFVTMRVGRAWDEAPRASARVRRPDGRWVRADNAVVILCPMPDPPLMVMTLGGDYVSEDGAACAFELALADLNDAGRAANGFVEHDVGSSSSAPSSLSIVSRAIVAVIDAALRGLDYKCIKSLGTEARWGGGVTTRSVCEVSASACVLRARLVLARSLLVRDGMDWRRSSRLDKRRLVARAVQVAVDIFAGVCVARVRDSRDVSFALERVVVGGWGTRPGSRDLLGTRVIETNARWISHGDPLGVKLHVPLARALGSLGVGFASTLSGAYESSSAVKAYLGFVSFSLRHGGIFGASMVFAIAADTMTIFTSHISALHVYSSLFITAQLRCVRFLYRRFINPKLPPKGFKAPLADARPRTVEEVVVGTLTLPPLLLLFPTVFFYYMSYLVLHAGTVLVRLVMVFAASTLLAFPTDDVLVRLWTPYAFPQSVDLRTRALHGVEFATIVPTCRSFGDVLQPFARQAGAWLGAVAVAVARACATCGRFPLALVPFSRAY